MRRPRLELSITRATGWVRAKVPDSGEVTSAVAQLALPAVVIGAGAGFAAVVFRWLITAATRLFSGSTDYSASVGHPANPLVPWLGGAFVIVAPAIGGLVYGPLVARFAPEARGHGVPEVMYAVAKNGGRIRPQVAVVKTIASAITIGSGGSVGREGPIIQIGSALGSTLGRLLKMPEDRMKLLVACGAAGAIAATFNAPVAGVFFGLELILRDFSARSFGIVAVSSITASVIGRSFLGSQAFLQLPSFHMQMPIEYLLFAVLGLAAGLAGGGFTKILYAVEDLADFLWRGPEWLRPVVGGLLLGLVLFVLPQMYGVGYPVLDAGVTGQYALGFLLVLVVGKVIATSLTLAIGGSGGVFAPSLFIGAMLGAAFGQVVGAIDPSLSGQAGAFAIVGMGAVLAGTTHAPITAGIMLFELTGDYTIVLPLLLAIAVATAASRAMSKDTVYTLKLRRRGIDLDAPTGVAMRPMKIERIMRHPVTVLDLETSLTEGARALLAAGQNALPLVSRDGRYDGVITMSALSEALGDDEGAGRLVVADVREDLPALVSGTELADALGPVLRAARSDGVPVVDGEGAVVGWLGHAAVLRVLADHEQPSATETTPAVRVPASA